MSTKVHDVLVEARALIADPERWTRYADARDARGNIVYFATRPDARQWCAYGAVIKAADGQPRVLSPSIAVLRRMARTGLARFNDDPDTTHADILALFDRAIEATKP